MRIDRLNDNRTEEQTRTHTVLYGGVDTFMSSWGPPVEAGSKSRAYWACRPEDCDKVRAWVKSREDIPRVEELGASDVLDPRVPARVRRDFVSVYVVTGRHPALD